MAVAGDRRRSRTLRIWVSRQPGLVTRIFTNSPSFLGTVCHQGFGETTTDICRYRSTERGLVAAKKETICGPQTSRASASNLEAGRVQEVTRRQSPQDG